MIELQYSIILNVNILIFNLKYSSHCLTKTPNNGFYLKRKPVQKPSPYS